MLDLLDLCLYFTDAMASDSDGEEGADQSTPGFIKRKTDLAMKVEGPSQLSSSFLVVVFGALIQSFDDLRKQKSNRLRAANALFVAAADHLVNHAILQLKDLQSYESDLDSDEQNSEHAEDEYDLGNVEEATTTNTSTTTPSVPKQRNTSPPKRSNPVGFMRRRRALLDDDLSEGESDLSEVSEEEDRIDDEIIYESDSASLFSQEMDSEEETEIKERQKSFRNTNNNTNHPKDSPATIIEEEEDEGSRKETRRLACSFMSVRRKEIVEEDEDEIDEADEDERDDEQDDDDRGNQELVFEFEGGEVENLNAEESEKDQKEERVEQKVNLEEAVNMFESFNILHPIKIICDWLFVNDEIVMENLNSPLWTRLVHLVNLLEIDEMIKIKGGISDEAAHLLKENHWMQPFSLWEDR